MARLSVVAISEAFAGFWTRLAQDLAVAIDLNGPDEFVGPKPDTIAVILAAGGAERDAARWLGTHPVRPGLPTLVVGTDPERRTAMLLLTRGATDYFALPDDLEIFRNAVTAALNGGGAPKEHTSDHTHAFAEIVGQSEAMREVLGRAARLLPHRHASLLLLGETGTGKELLARAIHAGGPRHAAPFVAINCSAIPEHLLESELFGHERGSFTDAHAAKPGLFEVADCGTLFLDEVGDLPLGLQAKLLRVLEDKTIRRVGGTKERAVDVRILAATNGRLSEQVREGTFREDLFFRLSTVVLTLPPLRARGDDVLLIAEALLRRLAAEHELPVPMLTAEARDRLRAHAWPGNVRELKNAIERALLLAPAGKLGAEELLSPAGPPGYRDGALPFPASLGEIMKAAARATVELCRGNRRESARRLRISTRRLRRLLRDGQSAEPEGDDGEEPSTALGASLTSWHSGVP